jgi:hypothetical protein
MMLTVLIPLPMPCVIVTALGVLARVNDGLPCVMLTPTVVELVNWPDIPVIVTVAGPGVAVELTVKVSVLEVVAGFGLNDAVIPFGSPAAVRLTCPLKPPCGKIDIRLVPLVPSGMISEFGVAANVKFGLGSGQLFTRLATFTVPIPVAKSQPVVALYAG